MKYSTLLQCLFVFGVQCAVAQRTNPADAYLEPSAPITHDMRDWEKLDAHKLHLSWASRDSHYAKHSVPVVSATLDTSIYAWRGERISAAAVMYTRAAYGKLSLRVTGGTMAANAQARFINYVLTDEYRACGYNPMNTTPYLVPDVIDNAVAKRVMPYTARPIWCTIEVPRNAAAGVHKMIVEVINEERKVIGSLQLRVKVSARLLPQPHEQAFHLDLWQQPYAVSRYYGVPAWSEKHFEAMRPYIKMLARAGQKVASAILFYEPWGEQSHDKFEPMVETIRNADGTWDFRYDVFDRWIEFLDSCGINSQINCFSMVPWDMNFRYYDKAKGQYEYLHTTTATPEYADLWSHFLKSFASHLRTKGWYDKTAIAMDERSLSAMQDAYRIAQEAVPGIKMSLAGNYHEDLCDLLYDYCVAAAIQSCRTRGSQCAWADKHHLHGMS